MVNVLKSISYKLAIKICLTLFIIDIKFIMSDLAKNNNLDYFESIVKGLKNSHLFQSKGKILADQVCEKLQQKILTSQVILPAETGTKNLVIPKKIIQVPQESEQDLLKKVQVEKMSLLEKMRDLSKQQDQLKSKIKAIPSKERILYKPNISEQEKERFKQLVKSNRLFEKSLKAKSKQITELYRQKSLEEIKLYEQQQNLKREQNREKASQKLKSIEARIAERKQAYEQSLKNMRQIKEKQYLYLKNQELEEQKRIEQQKQYQRKLQQIRQTLRIDIESIKQHEKNYERHLEESHMRMQQRSVQKSNHRHTKSYADNYFSVVTKARIEQKKQEQLEKMKQPHIFKQRICKYQQKLSTQFKPKISNTSKFTPMKQSLSAHILTSMEQRQKGIEYLQLAKKLKGGEKEKKRRMTVAVKNEGYKDYTKDLKYKTYESAENKFITLVKHKNSLSSYENASKALQLAVQIEAKSKLTSDKKLLSSVHNKIQLLNALQ